MTRHFCTYFDHRYLPRALVLRDSLAEHVSDFRLWALCMDDAAADALTRLAVERIEVVPLSTLEAHDPELASVRGSRSLVEYYFTCSPAFPRDLFEQHPDIDELTYLDADLFFLTSPDEIFDEIGDAPVAIVPHRYPPDRPEDRQWGEFNVGWLTFRRSGMAVVDWWRARCLEWCYDRVEDGKFADQGYLDQFPRLFPDTHVITNPGANLAPWNVRTHAIQAVGGQLRADGRPVVFYHVQGLRAVGRDVYRLGLEPYGARATTELKQLVYRPYIERLAAATDQVGTVLPSGISDALRHPRRGFSSGTLRAHLRSLVRGDLLRVRA